MLCERIQVWARPLSRMRIIAFAKGTQGIVKLEALIFIFLEKVIEMRRCSEVAFKCHYELIHTNACGMALSSR